MIRFFRLAAILAIATLSTPAALAQDTTINIKSFHFMPMNVTVTPGSSVTWKNLDEEPHTVTSESGLFASGGLDTNESFTFKFDKPGVYKYRCSIHPQMTATVTVK
ncbi:MAG: cupredoxin family copper-binding protein [Alphaproteobacteria bacterium]|nr:cupredoxin family copper-binding protein [Alphaproteobacteria bacterium]